MPRPKKNTEPLKVQEVQTSIVTLELNPVERRELRLMLNSPLFVKAWTIANTLKPSAARHDSAYDGQFGQQIANNKLHQILGWEMCAAALISLVNEPRKPITEVTITFTQQ